MNKILTIILAIVLSLPIAVWAADSIEDTVTVQSETDFPVVNTLDDEVDIQEDEVQYKQPISKRKIAKKFLAAMAGVTLSSVAIFILLTVYNRFRERYLSAVKTPDGEISLETPEDINSAIKTFLDKTKW